MFVIHIFIKHLRAHAQVLLVELFRADEAQVLSCCAYDTNIIEREYNFDVSARRGRVCVMSARVCIIKTENRTLGTRMVLMGKFHLYE